jgi:ADP-heptose:LPS heptosyltransferase
MPLDLDPHQVKRVLIYRLGSLGDTVVVLPALHLVARAFPSARRLMLTNIPVHAKAPAVSAILGDSGLVHDYMSYPVGTRGVRELLRLWWNIARFRPQVMVYLTKPRGERVVKRDAVFFRLCGVRRMVGLPLGDLAAPLYFPEQDIWEHESQRLLRTVSELGESSIDDPANWDLRLTAAELQRGRAARAPFQERPFLVCGPGTKMQAKDWGDHNWRALLSALSTQLPGFGLMLIGAREDAQVAHLASEEWSGPKVNLCGELTPRETAAAMQGASLFLGPDSGPMHLAAAQGIPCTIAFASRDKRGYWFPAGRGHQVVYHAVDCSLCELEVCIEQKRKCLTSITVDEMLHAALRAMKREAWVRLG